VSTTTSQDHPAAKLEFTEEHGVDPGRVSTMFAGIGLLLIVIGDFASFNIALSRTFSTMSGHMVLMLTLAMTAAAVVLMYEAGKSEARRKSRNSGRTGRGPVRNRVGAWLLLGATAFVLRMAAPPESADTGGFGQAADSGFGATTGAGFGQAADAATTMALGPMDLHTANTASALALLAIFIAGGIGAFYLGRESYNPRLTDVRRARQSERATARKLAWALRRNDRARRRAGDLTAAWEQHSDATRELATIGDLEHQLDLYEATANDLTQTHARTRALADAIAATEVELASIADDVRLSQRRADHSGAQAKALARVLIAEYRGEPAATSGLTNGADQ
jgi:hypothetical protein